ncbi:MAG TPA: hypothetical protein VF808_00735 [Ktedonobacterales bacterium]
MPREKSGLSPTPFAQVLTNYMARQRPIWTSGRIAQACRIRRSSVSNWLYHDITPPLDKMLMVLARLNIPMSELLDAYRAAGVPTPPLGFEEPSGSDGRDGPEGQTAYASGGAGHERPRQARIAEGAGTGAETSQEQDAERRWREKIQATREVLTATGFPPAALDGLMASIEAARVGQAPLEKHITCEFEEDEEDETDGQASGGSGGSGGASGRGQNPQHNPPDTARRR